MILQTKWGIKTDCPHCGALRHEVGFHIQITTLWANRYGEQIRLWCDLCGMEADIRGDKQGVRVVRLEPSHRHLMASVE